MASSFIALVCFWQVRQNTFVGHINDSSLQRVREGPNHLLSGSTAPNREGRRHRTNGGLLCTWDCRHSGSVLCRKSQVRWLEPSVCGAACWLVLCGRLLLRQVRSPQLQRPWGIASQGAGHHVAEQRLWGQLPSFMQTGSCDS